MLLFERVSKKLKESFNQLELAPFTPYKDKFRGKVGIEVGGPSGIFQAGNILPVYALAQRVDGVNFSGYTVWENTIKPGNTYQYAPGKTGEQFILEASDLKAIPDNKYDFLLASHCLEHCANAISTVAEWKRVVKPGGILLLALPDQRVTFDRKRIITNFDHLLADFRHNIKEDDLTHLPEILSLHDLTLDPGVADRQTFELRSQRNVENRCLHHHVFNLPLLQQLMTYLDLDVLFTSKFLPSLIIGACKPL